MYTPDSSRIFAVGESYADVNWQDFRSVVAAFQRKLEYWYVLPGLELMKEAHFGFSQAATACLLIDCLSQFEAGNEQSRASEFKGFLRKHWPAEMATVFPTSISANFHGPFDVRDGADAIYHGVRCGILHEAHVAIYTALTAQPTIVHFHATGLATYSASGAPCPVVTIDPGRLFNAAHQRLISYVGELLDPNPAHLHLRQNFQKKFQHSYGIAISIAL